MFHLLLVNFSKVTSEKVQNICSQSADFVLYESNSLEKAVSFCKQIKIHCVLLMPDPDFICKTFYDVPSKVSNQHPYAGDPAFIPNCPYSASDSSVEFYRNLYASPFH